MNTINDYDIGSLVWVKAEIDQALTNANTKLQSFVQNTHQTSEAAACATHLHQVSGAVQMVGLDGVACFTDAIEAAAQSLVKKGAEVAPEHIDLIAGSIEALSAFLESLINGAPNVPLKLYPQYSNIKEITGQNASPIDLFFPNLHISPVIHTAHTHIKDHELPNYLRQQRTRFQTGLVQFLRTQSQVGLQNMYHVLRNVVRVQTISAQRLFWWVATGFVESLTNPNENDAATANALLTRIDLQLKRAAYGSNKVTERLFRDLLYHIGMSHVETETVRLIRQAFDLNILIPTLQNNESELRIQQQQAKYAKDVLSIMQDAWIKYSGGDADRITTVQQELARFALAVKPLKHHDMSTISSALQAAIGYFAARQDVVNEQEGLEIATTLLVLENALTHFPPPADEFQADVLALVARLQALKTNTLDNNPNLPALPLLDKGTLAMQEKMLRSIVSQEIRGNLKEIERVLDAYFRDQTENAELSSVASKLAQINGALLMLEQTEAAEIVNFCIKRAALLGGETLPANEDLEFLAENLNAVGFFIDDLELNKGNAHAQLEPLLDRIRGKKVSASNDAPSQPLITVEQEISAQKHQVKELTDALKEAPHDHHTRDQLRETLNSLQQNADLTADSTLLEQSTSALQLLDTPIDAQNTQLPETNFVAAINEMSAAIPVAASSNAIDQHLSEEAVDAELLEIYLEEAEEVLAAIQANSSICRANPKDKEAMTVLRRGFHTLKGSGRMVGLMHLGDIGWAAEQMMNKWLQEEKSPTPFLLDAVEYACECFSRWISELKETGHANLDPAKLLEMINIVNSNVVSNPASQTVEKAPTAAKAPSVEASISPVVTNSIPTPTIQTNNNGDVQIGTISLSPVLYKIFTDEAQLHLNTLCTHIHDLQHNPQQQLSKGFLLAAHTLAGVANTTGFTALGKLTLTLEAWIAQQVREPSSIGKDEIVVITQTIHHLEEMFTGIKNGQEPQLATDLIAELHTFIIDLNVNDVEKVSILESQYHESEVTEETTSVTVDEVIDYAEIPAPSTPEPIHSIQEEVNILHTTVLQDDSFPVEKQYKTVETQAVSPTVITPQASSKNTEASTTADATTSSVLKDDIDEQLLPIFIEEGQELIPQISTGLRAWRSNPQQKDTHLDILKRALHTLKGSARMAGAMRLGEATHNLESRLLQIADLPSSPALFDELENQFDDVTQYFDYLVHGEPSEAQAAPDIQAAQIAAVEAEAIKASIRVKAEIIDRLVNQAGEISIARSRIESEMLAFKRSLLDLSENITRLRAQIREIEIQAESQMQSKHLLATDESQFDPLEFDRFTRLQELTRFVAESVNDVSTIQFNLSSNLDESNAALLQQNRMTRDLQQDLMGVRMVQFGSMSERLYRIVRQTGKELGKKVNLEMRGSNVDIDRSVLDKMISPFEHMLRNAIDHGLESKEARLAAKKSEVGEISLQVQHEGNELLLQLKDDGAGLNTDRIRQKAIEKGIIQATDQLTKQQIMNLIFAAGFSTAETVTQLSGRGIGMDVVKSEITNLGGRIEVDAELGKGTRFTIHLPLTLAVSQVVLVNVAGKLFGVPSVMIEQVQEVKVDALTQLYDKGSVSWQNQSYPFIYMPRIIGNYDAVPETKRYTTLLLIRSGSQRVALHVDALVKNQEVVVKNLGAQLSRAPGIVGATVLGNGEIVLIINPIQLFDIHQQTQQQRQELIAAGKISATPTKEAKMNTAPVVMVVDDSLTVRKITSRLLARENYQVMTAKDGVDALQQIQDIQPDIMLVDIEMPRMDGFELTRTLRADGEYMNIPIIMISSRTADKHQNYAFELGVNAFLGKPYQEDELLAEITRLLT